MYYFCTYFDQHYLDKGLALYQSLTMHCSPFRLWILCMDKVTYRILTDMQLPQVQLISLSDFEKDDTQLLQAKQNRSLIEYYFTCTPSLPLYVVDHDPEVDIITYLDADLYFFSSIKPVYQELGPGSVLIVGHRFPQALKNREIYGIYNVGMLSFRRDNNGLACLKWWRDRCIEWCFDRVENGRFADQKYLDDWPDKFAGVVVLHHTGAGLAPWNLANYGYSLKNTKLLIDGQPVIVYHFHGVKRVNRWIYDTNIIDYKTQLPKMVKHELYIPYLKELNQVNRILDKYDWGNLCWKQSIRGPIETRISLKEKIFALPQIGLLLLKYFQKCVNNDLILTCETRDLFCK
jgi:hypothetical protein